MYVTSVRVRIGVVASGQEGELHTYCHSTANSLFSTHHCTNQVLDSYNVLNHVFRASWAPCEGRYMPVPGPGGLGPLHTTTCSSAQQPNSRTQPRQMIRRHLSIPQASIIAFCGDRGVPVVP